MKTAEFLLFVASIPLLATCGGATGGVPNRSQPNPQSSATCPPPVPGPRPVLDLSYPIPGSTAVPIDIGQVIFVGFYQGVTGNASISVLTASGTRVPVGAFVAAPSPMPTPYAIPTGWSGNIPFVAAPVPTLSPSTTYNITYAFTDDGGAPPSCTSQVTETSGSFTTR